MFWWGNFFSITLQLSGTFKKRFATAITGHYGFLQQNDYWICIAADPWQHHFNEDNYIRVKNCDETQLAAMLAREPFIKLAKKISLQQWEDATIFLEKSFEEITQILKSKLHR